MEDGLLSFSTSEQMYQYSRLTHHGLHEAAARVVDADSGFDAMKLVNGALPKENTLTEWMEKAVPTMVECICAKLKACPHVHESLMDSTGQLVEVTSDKFWGSGMSVEMTRSTLPDYWPGKNHMGEILKTLWFEFCLRSDNPDMSEDQVKGICIAQ